MRKLGKFCRYCRVFYIPTKGNNHTCPKSSCSDKREKGNIRLLISRIIIGIISIVAIAAVIIYLLLVYYMGIIQAVNH